MKIAIIGTRGYPYVYGGFETLVRELGERLVKKDVEVHVYCQKNLFNPRPPQVNGVHLHYIPTLKGKSVNQIVHCFLSIIHATFSSTDVIFAVNLAAGPMGWIPKLTGKKTVINVDGLEWLRPKWKGLGGTYFYFAAKMAVKLFDQIITDAEAMHKIYLDEFHTESKVIAYGAPPFAPAGEELIERFSLHKGEYYLIVGRLIPDNNADLIIKGFLNSKSTKKLVVVGDVPYADEFAESLKNLKNEKLIFLGYITDQQELAALYQNSFAYIHGHKFGGTNPAMLKAMSNNCAIIALDTVFNREMLNDGEFGLFFGEREDSVATCLELLEEQPDQLEKLRSTVSSGLTDKYNWDHVASSYYETMKALLKPSK